jgi:hypothetical protein
MMFYLGTRKNVPSNLDAMSETVVAVVLDAYAMETEQCVRTWIACTCKGFRLTPCVNTLRQRTMSRGMHRCSTCR